RRALPARRAGHARRPGRAQDDSEHGQRPQRANGRRARADLNVRARPVFVAASLVVAVLVAAAWRTASPSLQHAAVRLARPGPGGLPLTVDVWRDQSDGEFAFRLRGDGDVSLMHGRTIYDVVDGRLSDVTVYSSVRRASNIIGARFGLTQARTTAALAGES